MTYPFPVVTELLVDGTWRDVTADTRGPVAMTRGRLNEGGRVGPGRYELVLDNTDGKYSNRNPLSPYFGLLGRNTQIRHRLADPILFPTPTYRSASTAEFTGGSTSVTAPAGVTNGDMLVAFHTADVGAFGSMLPPDGNDSWQLLVWMFTLSVGLATKVWWKIATAEPSSYVFTQRDGGDGVVTMVAVQSPGTAKPLARTLVEQSPGATFDTPSTIPPGHSGLELRWVAASDTTGASGLSWTSPPGFTERSDLQSGSFTTGSLATRTLTSGDATGVHTFTLSSSTFDECHGVTVNVVDDSVRFHGEVPSWSPRWQAGNVDVTVPVKAAGILRRLEANDGLLKPALRRAIEPTAPIMYVPLDEPAGSTQAASALTGGAPMVGDAAGFGESGPAGAPVLLDLSAGGQLAGPIPLVSGVSAWQVEAVVEFPAGLGGATAETAVRWTATGGSLVALDFDASTTEASLHWFTTSSSGTITFPAGSNVYTGLPHLWWVLVEQVAGDIVLNVGVDGTSTINNIGAGTIGSPSGAGVGLFPRTLANQAKVGHLAVWTGSAAMVAESTSGLRSTAMLGHAGERATLRLVRLCAEEGIEIEVIGDWFLGALMGPQRPGALIDLLRDCEAADMGILYEPRSRFGLAYRTRTSMHNQIPVILDYAAHHLHGSLQPQDDDQLVRNDVTVTRSGGSSARQARQLGALSVQAPPAGVGTYEVAVTLNLSSDSQLSDAAGWLLHLGTWDEARYPVVNAYLHSPTYRSHTVLTRAAAALDVGDLLSLTNLPDFLPPDPADLVVQGATEVLDAVRWERAWTATPGGPWTVGVLDDDDLGKLDTDGSALADAITSSATSFDVATTAAPPAPLWTTDDSEVPLDIHVGGERMTVTDTAASVITFGSTGTVAHGNNANVTPGIPASVAAGNLLLCLAAIRNSGAGVPDTPAGYARLPVFEAASNVQLFGKVATSGSETAPTITFTGGVANADTSAQMIRLAGKFHNVANLVVAHASALNAAATDIAYPGLSIDVANCLVLYLAWKADDWTAVTSPGTEIDEPDTTTGDDQGIVWAYTIQTTPTTIAPGSFTVTGSASVTNRGAVLAIRCDKQTFTVTRSVNGVVKAHSAGTAVGLWTPLTVAL